mgnify:CR=1 FL=1
MLPKDIDYSRKKLKNGLDVILAPMPESPTVTALVLFKVGSRHEKDEILGISHFVEHLVFKGNKLFKNPKDVAGFIENIGGSFNAFTSKEYTGFYVKVGADFLPKALTWLGALVGSPSFRREDLEMERNVIFEEINMYNDTPARQIQDYYENLIFKNSPLGRSIIGDRESLNRIERKEIQEHFNRHYTYGKSVLVIAGNLSSLEKSDLEGSFNLKKKEFSPVKFEKKERKQARRVKAFFKKTDQTHLVLGAKTFSYNDRRRHHLSLISTIMGGGMSSWAFSEIREKRGLAYYVGSFSDLHSDTGSFAIRAGLNNEKLALAVKEIVKLFHRIKEKKLSTATLKKAKDQILGGMLLERETSDDVAFILGSEILARNKIIPLSQEIKELKKISAEEIRAVADKFFRPKNLHLAFIGPWKEEDASKMKALIK